MRKTISRVVSVAAFLMAASFSFSARGEESEPPRRAPFHEKVVVGARAPLVAQARSRELRFTSYDNVQTVVRRRTPGKGFATFSADPQPLEPGSRMVFEIRSEADSGSTSRWRCVAVRDVAECLGAPVRVRYLPGDRQVVLTAQLRPTNEDSRSPTGLAQR